MFSVGFDSIYFRRWINTLRERSPLKRRKKKQTRNQSVRAIEIYYIHTHTHPLRSYCTRNLDTIYSVELFKIVFSSFRFFFLFINIVGASRIVRIHFTCFFFSQNTFTQALALENREKEIKTEWYDLQTTHSQSVGHDYKYIPCNGESSSLPFWHVLSFDVASYKQIIPINNMHNTASHSHI